MENVIVIGSGPAGYTASLYLSRADLSPLCLEGELSKDILPGGQLMTTTEVENYPGYPDGVSGPEMMEQFKKQAEKFGTRFAYKTVTKVDFSKRPFTLWADDEKFEAKSVVIATGASAKYLGLPSEEKFLNHGVSACATCDGALPRFRNKPIVVVGGGDTAMEEAMFLTKFASVVHLVHRRDEFRASKIMADRAKAHPKIQIHWSAVVEEILGDEKTGVTGVKIKNLKTGEIHEEPCTGYFAAIGHKPNADPFKEWMDLDENGYILTKPGTSYTKVEGVFACGDVQDHVYRQAITAAGSGCMAAIDCTRWLEANEH